jgi:catechol 2,3-dioxygenase-like lactoylglutathione lyase family enzyme
MDYRLEVVVLPVGDVDRALAFYTEQVGFTLDVDYRPSDDFRVVQLTPPGSHCSIQLVAGRTDAPDRSMYLVVTDIDAARRDLLGRGVDVGDIRHKSPIDGWQGGWQPGVDPQRGDYASFADFADPDGNTWALQERGFHPPG